MSGSEDRNASNNRETSSRRSSECANHVRSQETAKWHVPTCSISEKSATDRSSNESESESESSATSPFGLRRSSRDDSAFAVFDDDSERERVLNVFSVSVEAVDASRASSENAVEFCASFASLASLSGTVPEGIRTAAPIFGPGLRLDSANAERVDAGNTAACSSGSATAMRCGRRRRVSSTVSNPPPRTASLKCPTTSRSNTAGAASPHTSSKTAATSCRPW
mmetsp:Transcript_911/g.3842  ORF Transcript_911/g.3842 Transcript_911/m.3842 type:complete len:223 (-) Transcript_911:448-1116(-)